MKLLTYSLLSALISLLLIALFPLVLAVWLIWRAYLRARRQAHERRVLTHLSACNAQAEVVRCDGGEGQPSPTERAENRIDEFLERILTER